jgi:hypothetical protein
MASFLVGKITDKIIWAKFEPKNYWVGAKLK